MDHSVIIVLYLYFSFWGKFGQRSNMTQSKYVYSQAEFLRLIMDTTKILSDVHIINEHLCQLEYEHEDDHVPDTASGNVVVAAFTTCWARLKLYSVLETVGRQCLYYDTDSVIYVDDGLVNVPVGDYLGQLTDELNYGEHVVEFISGGPKNYSYLTNAGEEVCKVRGFTLNYQNSRLINFDSVKRVVLEQSGEKIYTVPEMKIVRDRKRRKLNNQEQRKGYQMVYTKRVILPNLDTIPFGY